MPWIPDPKFSGDPLFAEWEAAGEPSFFKWLKKPSKVRRCHEYFYGSSGWHKLSTISGNITSCSNDGLGSC